MSQQIVKLVVLIASSIKRDVVVMDGYVIHSRCFHRDLSERPGSCDRDEWILNRKLNTVFGLF